MINRNYVNVLSQTYIISNIGVSDTIIHVESTDSFAAPNFEIVIEPGTINQELCLCTGVTPTSMTIIRGFDNSNAVAHLVSGTNTLVQSTVSAIDPQEMNDHNTDKADDHTQYLNSSRHSNTALHQIGISIETDVPSDSTVGDIAQIGTSFYTAAQNHVHGRETLQEYSDNLIDVGMIKFWPIAQNIDPGWHIADGTSLRIDEFPILFSQYGYAFGGSSDYYVLIDGVYQNSLTIAPPATTHFYFNLPNISLINLGTSSMVVLIKLDSDLVPSVKPSPPPNPPAVIVPTRTVVIPPIPLRVSPIYYIGQACLTITPSALEGEVIAALVSLSDGTGWFYLTSFGGVYTSGAARLSAIYNGSYIGYYNQLSPQLQKINAPNGLGSGLSNFSQGSIALSGDGYVIYDNTGNSYNFPGAF